MIPTVIGDVDEACARHRKTLPGYVVLSNCGRGRSGATHEVDVLAEKRDELLTLSVAIECKAWANPIEKDVIAKFNEVRRDLGLGHALVISLNGARPGATSLADELGVVVWGPDEIEPILGRTSVLGLQNRPAVEEVGFPRRLAADDALDLVRRETSGRLGIGREEVVWAENVWIPVSVVPLTLLKMKMIGRSTNTSPAWAVYDLIAGTFVCRDETEPERTPVQLDGGQLKARLKVVDPVKTLDKVSAKFDQVTSEQAIKKYRGQLARLGVPDWHTATTGTPSPFLYPMFLAIARQKSGSERVVAIDAYRNRVDADLGVELSKQIAWVKESLGR